MKLEKEENKNTILAKISYVAVIGLTSILSLLIALLAIKLTVYFDVTLNFAGEASYFRSESLMLNIFLTFSFCLIFFILYNLINKVNKKILLVLAIIITTVLCFAWVYTIKLKPLADQLMVKTCALNIIDNKLDEILSPRRISK